MGANRYRWTDLNGGRMVAVSNTAKMICSKCQVEMNHHCDKIVYQAGMDDAGTDLGLGGIIEEFHACPQCGGGASRLEV